MGRGYREYTISNRAYDSWVFPNTMIFPLHVMYIVTLLISDAD